MTVISVKSAAMLLNVCELTARKRLSGLIKHYQLQPHQAICITKFCDYFALDLEVVTKMLKSKGWC